MSPKIFVALVSLALFMFVFAVTADQRASSRASGQTDRNLSHRLSIIERVWAVVRVSGCGWFDARRMR